MEQNFDERAGDVRGDTVHIQDGGARDVYATTVTLLPAAAAFVRANAARIGPSCRVGGLIAQQAVVEDSMVAAMLARGEARLDQSAVGVVVSNRAVLSGSAVGLAVAEVVEGDVRVQVKPQVAVLFGAALGAALGLLVLIGRRIR